MRKIIQTNVNQREPTGSCQNIAHWPLKDKHLEKNIKYHGDVTWAKYMGLTTAHSMITKAHLENEIEEILLTFHGLSHISYMHLGINQITAIFIFQRISTSVILQKVWTNFSMPTNSQILLQEFQKAHLWLISDGSPWSTPHTAIPFLSYWWVQLIKQLIKWNHPWSDYVNSTHLT